MKNNLIKWIVIHQHPFTIVEENNFINFIHTLHPTTQIPTADTIKSQILKFYEEDKEKIKSILMNLSGKISFTTDCWTSSSMKSFMSITAYFINKKWELRHILLNFIEMYDTYTSQNIKNTFILGLESFAIEKKVKFFIYYKKKLIN